MFRKIVFQEAASLASSVLKRLHAKQCIHVEVVQDMN